MSDRPAVLVDTKDAKLFITLNRPDVLNAQNDDMRSLLVGAIERLETDPDLLVAIVSGVGGRAFSAGADLGEVDGGDPRERVQPEDASRELAALRGVPVGVEADHRCDRRLVPRRRPRARQLLRRPHRD